MAGYFDGIKSLVNDLANLRNGQATNTVEPTNQLSDTTKRALYRTGIGNKIIRIKSGMALKDTLQFDSTADSTYYDKHLAAKVKQATKWLLAFGRGVIVVYMPGDDVSKPLNPNAIDPKRVKLKVFEDELVSPSGVELGLDSERYYKPKAYVIHGQTFHATRVVDFTYIAPPERDAPNYRYGGVSEFELIYAQLLNDGIIERASSTIIEKASTFIYRITGFKDSLRAKKEKELLEYFSKVEETRSIYGAVLLDQEDEATAVQQQLTNLAEVNEMSLRRIAMVTGLSVSRIVGEAVRGLNATGENERQMDQDTIEALQSDYLLAPLNQLFELLKLGPVKFKENQGETPTGKVEYEGKAIENALKLWQMGEDHSKYLEQKGVIEPDDWEAFWAADSEDEPPATPGETPFLYEGGETGTVSDMNVDPQSALNGAQVTAILEIIRRLRAGEISKATAEKVIVTSFPVSQSEAAELVRDVPENLEGQENGEASDQ